MKNLPKKNSYHNIKNTRIIEWINRNEDSYNVHNDNINNTNSNANFSENSVSQSNMEKCMCKFSYYKEKEYKQE